MKPPFCVSCIVPIERKILFVRHTYGVANGRILIPGGYLQDGELPSQAAVRELMEETGVTAVPTGLFSARCKGTQWILVFTMEYVSGKPRSDGHENSEVLLLRPKDAILRRNRLIAESRRLENDITALESDIDVTINKKKQLPYERLVLEELEAKIQEREVSMKAERTITIDQMGISLFPKFKEIPTLECCLFTSFLDYMAYKTICREDISLMGEEHIMCDCIVLNNPSNFSELMLEAAPYDKVHCMFPSTVAGRVMCETMKSCNPHAIDHY